MGKLDLTIDALCKTNYSPKALRSRLFQEPFILPRAYSRHALSYSRASAHIVEYLRLTLGTARTHQILLRMGVNPGFFDRLDNRINLRFFVDLLGRLKFEGLCSRQVSHCAHYIPLTLSSTELGSKFKCARSFPAVYRILSENSQSFDLNFSYKFRVHYDSVEIESSPSEQALDEWSGKLPFSEELFLYRKQLFGAFPLLAQLPPLSTRVVFFEESSLKIRYLINFPGPKHLRLLD